MKNIAIIGGGASAIICAIYASKSNNVTIFCDQEKLGKKILVTGNGRCNLTNLNFPQDVYNTNIDNFLNRFNHLDTMQFFNSLRLEIYPDSEGRVYPLSNTATSVLEVLNLEVSRNKNIVTKLNEKVTSVTQNNNCFFVQTINNKYNFDAVVVATGSTSSILDTLKMDYKPFTKSLVALKTKENTKRLMGLKLSDITATLKLNKTYTQSGEVLFKDNGLSGICIFNLSAYLARKNNFNAKIFVDLMPKLNLTQVEKILSNRLNLNTNTFNEFMQGLFHKEINKYLLKISKIDENCLLKNVQKEQIKLLAKNIKNLEFNIINCYDNNQVHSGGIMLNNLTNNLEHKNIKNLYFAGEVVDVDGICGGYNLQWAFTSGKIVGESI